MPYETKPMKKQWLEVDGRLTPIILPQIWNHELQDWVVTSEQNPLPTQVTGSSVAKQLFYGALTKIRFTGFNGGVQFDGGGTSQPRIPADTIREVLNVAGAGKGIYMRVVTKNVDNYLLGIRVNMDGTKIIDANAVYPEGRFINFASFKRFGLTQKGDTVSIARVSLWDESNSTYVFDLDISQLGVFQNNFTVSLVNDTESDEALTTLIYYEALASPELTKKSMKDISADFLRNKLREKYGNEDDFTVIKTIEQGEVDDLFVYTVFYRNEVKQSEIKSFVDSILN